LKTPGCAGEFKKSFSVQENKEKLLLKAKRLPTAIITKGDYQK